MRRLRIVRPCIGLAYMAILFMLRALRSQLARFAAHRARSRFKFQQIAQGTVDEPEEEDEEFPETGGAPKPGM